MYWLIRATVLRPMKPCYVVGACVVVYSEKPMGYKPLTCWARRYHQLMGRSRYKIERVFGSISVGVRGNGLRRPGEDPRPAWVGGLSGQLI